MSTTAATGNGQVGRSARAIQSDLGCGLVTAGAGSPGGGLLAPRPRQEAGLHRSRRQPGRRPHEAAPEGSLRLLLCLVVIVVWLRVPLAAQARGFRSSLAGGLLSMP